MHLIRQARRQPHIAAPLHLAVHVDKHLARFDAMKRMHNRQHVPDVRLELERTRVCRTGATADLHAERAVLQQPSEADGLFSEEAVDARMWGSARLGALHKSRYKACNGRRGRVWTAAARRSGLQTDPRVERETVRRPLWNARQHQTLPQRRVRRRPGGRPRRHGPHWARRN